MGCSATKNLTVTELDGATANGLEEPRKTSIPRRVSDVPPLVGDEPQTEMLENANVNNVQKTANGLSFDIAFEDDNESIIRKHPPKRFQKLEEQQTSPNLSLTRLQEKLDEAEIRRQQILQQRIQSAKVRNQLKKQANISTENEEEEDRNHLHVPSGETLNGNNI